MAYTTGNQYDDFDLYYDPAPTSAAIAKAATANRSANDETAAYLVMLSKSAKPSTREWADNMITDLRDLAEETETSSSGGRR